MSRVTDKDLRAAFRSRAEGRPDPALHQRITSEVLEAKGPRRGPTAEDLQDRRSTPVRLTAVAAVAALLLVAPLVGAQPQIPLGLAGPSDGSAGPVAGGTPVATGDDDEPDDAGDGEDGVDDDDDADEINGVDVPDGEDGVDEPDDGAGDDDGEEPGDGEDWVDEPDADATEDETNDD